MVITADDGKNYNTEVYKNVTLTDNIKYISKDVWRHSKNVIDEEKIFSSREITKQFYPKDKDVTNIEELENQIMNE